MRSHRVFQLSGFRISQSDWIAEFWTTQRGFSSLASPFPWHGQTRNRFVKACTEDKTVGEQFSLYQQRC
jgi:hypothetical protein